MILARLALENDSHTPVMVGERSPVHFHQVGVCDNLSIEQTVTVTSICQRLLCVEFHGEGT